MWGFLFFLPCPSPIPIEVLGWALLLIGVGRMASRVDGLRPLFLAAAAGVAVWAVRVVRGLPPATEAGGVDLAHVALYAATWALLTTFTVRLAAVIGRIARQIGADDLARSVAWRAWLPLLPLVLFAALPFLPPGIALPAGCASLGVSVIVISLVMGIAAGAVRMFALAAGEAPEREPDEPAV